LLSASDKKISVIKAALCQSRLGLAEAKALVSAPKPVLEAALIGRRTPPRRSWKKRARRSK
jgi:ribosomal protein L7/L12